MPTRVIKYFTRADLEAIPKGQRSKAVDPLIEAMDYELRYPITYHHLHEPNVRITFTTNGGDIREMDVPLRWFNRLGTADVNY